MILQKLVLNWVAKIVYKMIEDFNDDRIARTHHKRLKALEKESQPQSDWISLDCGCNAKRVEKPTRKRRKRKKKRTK